MNRPFDIGDLIKIKFNPWPLWVIAETKNDRGGVGRINNDRLYFTNDDILVIRKYRPGNAESRAIVTELGKEALEEMRAIFYLTSEKIESCKSEKQKKLLREQVKDMVKKASRRKRFLKFKEMLK